MKALMLREFNTPYHVVTLDKPVAQERQVLVKIKASGVNPLDLKICAGQAAHARPQLPAVLGIDMAGVIESIGDRVTDFVPGDEVYGMTGGIAGIQGSLAEYAAVDVDLIALKPNNLSMKEAASIPLVLITAWEGLVDRASVGEGQTVLIHGGAGGVGHMAVQIAIARGANVFATCNPNQQEQVLNYGATAIDYTSMSVEQYVEEYTAGEGFDVILDTIGGVTLDNSFQAVKQYTGHVVSVLGWGTHSLAPLSFHGATYSGVFTLYPLITGKHRAHQGAILTEATKLIQAGKVVPLVDPTPYTIKTINAAYQALQQQTTKGKVVIDIGQFSDEP